MILKAFNFLIVVLLCFTFIQSGCNNNNPVTPENPFENFRYPYQNNINWFYKYKIVLHNIRPDSVRIYIPNDTIDGTGLSIFTHDTVINGQTSKLLKSEHISSLHSHTTLESFIQTDTGLISTFGGEFGRSFGPYSPPRNVKFLFNGKEYNDPVEILNYYKTVYTPDLPIVDTTPVNCIKYPVETGTQWHFINFGSGLNASKKYTGITDIVTPIGSLKCMQVQKIYTNSSGQDTNIVFYDYLSQKGMVSRDYNINNITISNSFGQVIGYFDVREEYMIQLINGF